MTQLASRNKCYIISARLLREIEKAITNGIRFITAPGQDHIHVAARSSNG